MNNKEKGFTRIVSIIIVLLLCLPPLQSVFHIFHEKPLYGYAEKNLEKPGSLVKGWFDRKWQKYWESMFDEKAGFRTVLIRGFNELSFRLFSEMPHLNLYSTKEHGLYFRVSIDQLNNAYINRKKLTKSYNEFAKKVQKLQQLLEANGKHFIVVISSSKPYVHPQGLGKRLLVSTDKNLFREIANLGYELKRQGVNVIDSAPFLRTFYRKKAIETHANTGVHWNYYTGCMVAQQLFYNSKKTLIDIPKLKCGNPIYKKPEMVDLDGLLLMNVFSNVNLAKPNPYPQPSAKFFGNYRPKILLVGDSFMDQMIHALDRSKAYENLVYSRYFQTRTLHKPERSFVFNDFPSLTEQQIQADILDDVMKSDLIVLQMVDYNINRLGYGFIDALLERLKNSTNPEVQSHIPPIAGIKIINVNNAYPQEKNEENWWYWVKNKIIFQLQPLDVFLEMKSTRLYFEYDLHGAQQLIVYLKGKGIKHKIIIDQPTNGKKAVYDQILGIPPASLTRIIIMANGTATRLSETDSRLAAYAIFNLKIIPIS
ncbi:hypothetical protein LEAN103870_00380 [Legionella anisa]|uniref:AlgX/AlgJ SGNH hydrolase-like domain-containing protein n=1 Tax=Legionella anisa TaxID=28082 RepID=A0AAX0WVW7_9GAMM|nr:hypothetical protein [Legionella anisa]AWN73957.1 hypothetical protein DLD14_08975 [Legionella anisa]KTC67228.1 hypothetical protein Lani_3573 [Legionella anisa]MCW8426027.1 hypothetical protein [Legionella anisa]MCW8448539.1 hypothetical protein [Legionella anisa]PNL62140.1 hypothetical protein A6J39_013455 [Legionella anisa]